MVVPLLNTAEDARRLVASAKFPPQGIRGFGSPFAMEKFSNVSMTDYLQQGGLSPFPRGEGANRESQRRPRDDCTD